MLKRILSVLLICLLLTGCGSSTPAEAVEKQLLTSMESEFWQTLLYDTVHTIHISEYGYDEYGRKVREKLILNDETVTSSRYFWSRDGLECTEISFDHQGWIPRPIFRVKEVYNENGKVREKTMYKFFTVSQRSIYSYDDAGNLIRLEATDGEGNLEILQEYTWDENGNRLRTTDLSPDGVQSIVEYTYDETGNQTGWYSRENGVLQEYVETTYDEQGRKVFSARYDGNGERLHYWEYTYSDDGLEMTTSYSGERTSIDYYNEAGQCFRIETYDNDGNLTGVTNYTYETIQVNQKPNP